MKCKTTGKTKFSELDAKIALSEVTSVEVHHRHRKFREVPKRHYECEFCHSWHLTSQDRRGAA